MKTARVDYIEYKNDYQNQHGTFYDFFVEMSNGDVGFYTAADRHKHYMQQGETVNYDVIEKMSRAGKPFYKFKPISDKEVARRAEQGGETNNGNRNQTRPQPQRSGGGKRDEATELRIVKQSSLKGALELLNAGTVQQEHLMVVAEYFADWVMGKAPAMQISNVIEAAERQGERPAQEHHNAQPEDYERPIQPVSPQNEPPF